MFKNYVCVLDIGSTAISAGCAEIRRGSVQRLFLETAPSAGVHRGVIVDSVELLEKISVVLKKLKERSGIPIRTVCATFSGQDLVTRHSKAVIPLAERGNKVITLSDIEQVNEQARILGSTLEEEILHQLPYSYRVDSKTGLANPQGLYGHTLEVDLYLICAKLSSVQTLTHVIHQSGCDLKEVFFTGLAAAEAVLHDKARKNTALVCDIGGDVTELLLFSEGRLRDMRIVPAGGSDLTAALSSSLGLSLALAEEIKVSHGTVADPGLIDDTKEVLIKTDSGYSPLRQRQICEALVPPARKLCAAVKENIESMVRLADIDTCIVCGRCLLLDRYMEMLESSLGVPLEIGRLQDNDWLKENGSSATAPMTQAAVIGRILKEIRSPSSSGEKPRVRNPFVKVVRKAREVYQEYF